MVIASGSQLSFGPNSLRLTWIRGTRSHPVAPPLPTVCLQDWVHPFEDPPERRFHLYTAEGLLLKTVLSPIPESFLGDTLIIPIQF